MFPRHCFIAPHCGFSTYSSPCLQDRCKYIFVSAIIYSQWKGALLRLQAKRAKLAPGAKPELEPKPEERPGAAARSLRQAFLVERLLCEADAAEV